MPALNFPASSSSPWTAPNGVIYTWNADGYWEAKADPNDFDTDYLKLNATNDPVTGNLALDQDLDVGDNLDVTGTSAFTGLTTHEGGVKVTGGTADTVKTGMYKLGSGLNIVHNSSPVVQLYDNGTAKCWTFGAPQDANIGFNVKSTPNVFSPGGAATQTGASFKTYIKDNAKSVTNITSLPDFGTSSSIENLALYAGNLSTVVPASGTAFKNQYVYFAGSASNTDKFSAANNYGFYSEIYNSNVGKDNYNFYAAGTAPNYFAGDILTGSSGITKTAILAGTSTGYFTSAGGEIAGCRLSANTPGLLRLSRGGGVSGRSFVDFYDAGVELGSITTNGAVISVNGTSDYRVKTNIQPLPSAIEAIKSIQPVSFEYTDRTVGQTYKGFIAHQLQEAGITEAVTGTKDGTEAIGTLADYDGTELETEVTEPAAEELEYTEEVETDGVTTQVVRTRSWTATGTRPVYQGVDQTKLIPLLVKSLQEALERIEALEAQLNP